MACLVLLMTTQKNSIVLFAQCERENRFKNATFNNADCQYTFVAYIIYNYKILTLYSKCFFFIIMFAI